MSIRTGKLTVFFEEPFWVGIFERVENGKLSVSKVTFGTEPKDYEIWEFVLKEYDRLQFSPSVEVTEKELTKNPKKLQREIHKQMLDRGAGTKSQQALKLQQEQRKQQRKSKSREDKLAEEKKMFDLKQKKKKENIDRHPGDSWGSGYRRYRFFYCLCCRLPDHGKSVWTGRRD